ncbi:MAG: Uma2 family endonuclease [Planctomycetes bacterium]|nr:Uma2 family endonuclease [Planctomycetota bacterium]
MATVVPPSPVSFPVQWSLADLQADLGDIPAERIRLVPPPGYATEEDVLRIADREDRLYELENGVLVEKPMGLYESIVAGLILSYINAFLEENDLGKASGADGPFRILPGIVKLPDVSFVGWSRWPKTPLPRGRTPSIVPHLAVEVLSESNTAREMENKLQRYFEAGVELVWYVDPESRSARVFTSPTDVTTVDENGLLDGGAVLPGFQLSLRQLFERADRPGPA